MDPNRTNIEKLPCSNNYTTWHIRLNHLLKKEKLWKIITSVEAKLAPMTAEDGTITNCPNTGAGSIAE
jgi:hypothetical protein